MDKLEQYLDQVCRGIGGPRALRLHIRQELAEHLRDALAEHRNAGLPEDVALARVLEDFGGPDQLHSELAATHGERLLGVMIDTAIQWKEKTMRAKWLWTSWTYIAAVGVVVMEVLSLAFCNVFLLPKLKKIQSDGWLATEPEPTLARLQAFLNGLHWAGEYFTWIAIGVAVLWGLFEWRVRSENKTFMRLAALGTGAVGLAVAFFLTMAALVIPFELGLPGSKIARPWALETVASAETAVGMLEQALAKQNWDAVQEQAHRAERALSQLEKGPGLQALTSAGEPPTLAELRDHLALAKQVLLEVQQASADHDAPRLAYLLKKFRAAFDPLQQAAKKSSAK